jgi:hypothetical protein
MSLDPEIRKTLSANDLGLTGAHQAGMLVPKDPSIRGFFPPLDPSQLNPRCSIHVLDEQGASWSFVLIHYNNALVGSGTRNEYRLTRMTRFLRQHRAQPGDTLCLRKSAGHLRMRIIRGAASSAFEDGVIRHSGKWHVIRCSI